jgi:uncharacterized protein (TIGR03083 family)
LAAVDDQQLAAATVAGRRAVATWLAELDEVSLATLSLCRGWDVRTVAAHLASAVTATIPGFVLRALRHGGPHRANDASARALARRPVAEIARTLEDNADRRVRNPGVGLHGPLADVLVHTGDMRIPLGLEYSPPREPTSAALRFLTSGKAVGFVRRGDLAGLHVTADDLGASFGAGEQLRGRGADLMMAVCGRTAVLDRLSGPGVEILRGRLSH